MMQLVAAGLVLWAQVAQSSPPSRSQAFQRCPWGQQVPAGTHCPVVDAFWLTYFNRHSAALSVDGPAILEQVLRAFRFMEGITVDIEAHADRSEGEPEALSRRRAIVVRDFLVARGVPATSISIHARGTTRPHVETAAGQAEPQNRVVVILLNPPPL